MKPMLPNLTFDVPKGPDWVYETKYDGFRAIITIDQELEITSRNGRDLLPYFPEAKDFFAEYQETLNDYTPLVLDGEMSCLVNPYKSEFSHVQTRGRLRKKEKIEEARIEKPCYFLAFDILELKGENLTGLPFLERKKQLRLLFESLQLPLHPSPVQLTFMQQIPYTENFDELWQHIQLHDGEGIIAKQLQSKWEEGKRSLLWMKYKNWKKIQCFITRFNKSNGYFTLAVYSNKEIFIIGEFKNGMKKEEFISN